MEEELIIYDRFLCDKCADKGRLDFDFTMAFQPIVDCRNKNIFGYEALARGLNNESAYSVISKVTDENRYLFDQICRIKAIALAAKLEIKSVLSINFLPNAIYKPERCIRTTLDAAARYSFPVENILFEFTEVEKVKDNNHLKDIVDYYKAQNFMTALDDFGSGYSGLGLIADFQTSIIKFDMELIRNIDTNTARQSIISNCLNLFNELNVIALAEGVETKDEMQWLKNAGIDLQQGYFFAKPGFECLPEVDFSKIG